MKLAKVSQGHQVRWPQVRNFCGALFVEWVFCWMCPCACPAHRGDDVKDCPIFSVTCPLWHFSHRVKLHTHSVAGLAGQFIQSVGLHCPHYAAPAQYNIAVSTVHWLPEIQQLQICVRSQVQSLHILSMQLCSSCKDKENHSWSKWSIKL